MPYTNDWKKMVSDRLASNDKKLDKIIENMGTMKESMSGLKVKVYSVAAALSGIIAYLVNNI